ncbi:MAG: DUF2442 domain-containing protein [Pseudomonas sp.]
MVGVQSVTPLAGFVVHMKFTDGSERDIDLDPYLRGPVFEPLRASRALFEAVRVDARLGTIVWPNGADIDPDVLFAGGTPDWAHDSPKRR